MKKVLKSLALLGAFSLVIFVASCGKDDGPTIGGGDEGTFQVADGLYIAGINADTTIVSGAKLSAGKVEAPAFANKDRSGYFTGFAYLEVGNYLFVEVDEQESAAVYGGTATAYNDDAGDNDDDYTGSYSVVSDLSTSTNTFSVDKTGYYHIIFDTQEDEALLVKVSSWGVLGGAVFSDACTSDGFNADVDLATTVTESATGASYLGSGIILKGAEFKLRLNDNWKIDRRFGTLPDGDAAYDDEHGYVAVINYGGTVSALEAGAGNIGLSDNSIDDGIYDITFSFDDSGAPSVALSKTADAPVCAFNPANYEWGIIGDATFDMWNSQTKLEYIGQDGGTHNWRGVFPLVESKLFKFRADDAWAIKITAGSDGVTKTIVDNTDMGTLTNDGDTNADGNWTVASLAGGFLYVEISTSDDGDSWTLTLDEATFSATGEGSPTGCWPPDPDDGSCDTDLVYNNDVASASVSGMFTTAGWKIRVNGAWTLNYGGALDGSALVRDGSNFALSSAGTYQVTITTADGGETYTGSAVQP